MPNSLTKLNVSQEKL